MVTDFSDYPPEVQEILRERQRQYESAASRGRTSTAMQDAVGQLNMRASSRRGEVTVVVSGRGLLQDVAISPKGMELHADTLAQLIVNTIGQALTKLQNAVEDLAHDLGDDAVAQSMVAGYRTALSPHLRDEDSDQIRY